jgi:dinuclear metal center YbgI/SA1388 family protein
MARLLDITQFLDAELCTDAIRDYAGALNGLQIENSGRVDQVVAAVDASLPVIQEVARQSHTLLIVHHGMFWQGAQTITGPRYRKLRSAMDADLALFSSHLPLDIHPTLGNNAMLAKALGVVETTPFFEAKGQYVGLKGSISLDRSSLHAKLESVLGSPVHCCPAGPDRIKTVGIVTGGAGSELSQVAQEGVDTFITGEGPHWSYPLAEELGMNVFYGGHYATETFGVKAVAELVSRHFGIPWRFHDHPTGL